jgi:general secretion pathway protein G
LVTLATGALTLAACLGGPASLPPLEDRTGRAGQLPSGTCDFDIRMITNGAYPEAATSLWSCVQPNGTLLQVVIFDNFTGTSSAIGAFDFVTTGCRAGLIRDRLGRQALVTNLYGSRAAGTLSFEQEGVGAIACALVASNYADRERKARTQAAKTQIELLGVALDTFRFDVGRYPTTHEGLQALRTPPDGLSRWDGPYLKKEAPLDPWGRAYHYESPGRHGEYDLWSYGADGALGGERDGRDITSWEPDDERGAYRRAALAHV